jgi:hypothetical protein
MYGTGHFLVSGRWNLKAWCRSFVTFWQVKSESIFLWGRAVAHWLRHNATNRQVAGSIPDGVIAIF